MELVTARHPLIPSMRPAAHMMLAFSMVHTMTPVVAVSAAWLWLPP